ncbi:MAG: hypothetical protein ACYC2K_15085 [Gemmatimonadales bacterium]
MRQILEGRRRSLSLVAVLIGGCSSLAPSTPELPVGAVRMVADAEYQAWFARTQQCSGLNGQIDEIQWFVVPGVETFETSAGAKVGMWEKTGGVARITIAGNYARHEMVIRHEMLHHLLDREGHPGEFFTDRCGLTWETWSDSHHAD